MKSDERQTGVSIAPHASRRTDVMRMPPVVGQRPAVDRARGAIRMSAQDRMPNGDPCALTLWGTEEG